LPVPEAPGKLACRDNGRYQEFENSFPLRDPVAFATG
jgi:hypothetical protein